jgi:hypothetical protein
LASPSCLALALPIFDLFRVEFIDVILDQAVEVWVLAGEEQDVVGGDSRPAGMAAEALEVGSRGAWGVRRLNR